MIILDTSALLYWTLNRSALTPTALSSIQTASSLAISSISIWEIALKAKKGKLRLPVSSRQYLERIRTIEKISIIAVNEQIWLHSVDLAWFHQDPADRTIVATADLLSSPLVTSDKLIRDFYVASIW